MGLNGRGSRELENLLLKLEFHYTLLRYRLLIYNGYQAHCSLEYESVTILHNAVRFGMNVSAENYCGIQALDPVLVYW